MMRKIYAALYLILKSASVTILLFYEAPLFVAATQFIKHNGQTRHIALLYASHNVCGLDI